MLRAGIFSVLPSIHYDLSPPLPTTRSDARNLCVIIDFAMPLAKRARSVRRKKKSAPSAKNAVSKRRTRLTSVGKRKASASRYSSKATQERLIRQYHELLEKKLLGIATAKESAELEHVKTAMREIERAHSAPLEAALEQRHVGIMKKLEDLTDELRRFPAAAQR
jgi:hypothetical protein